MNIKRKIEMAEQAIRSISQHDDADLTIRDAALAKLGATIAAERTAAQARVQERVAEALGEGA